MLFANKPWPFQPRRWQAEAEPLILRHLSQPVATPAVIRAVMGSGKAISIARLAHQAVGAVVVTTSTQLLVRQLQKTIASLCGGDKSVGMFFADVKRIGDITVSCNDSLLNLSRRVQSPELLIVDECHRSEPDSIRQAIAALNPRHVLGYTATPFRASSKESLSLFSSLLYDYGPSQALADGVVVPWKIISCTSDGVLDDVCVDMIKTATGPGIVNATTIEDAEAFAAKINTKTIHSGVRDVSRRIQQLQDGTLRSLVHVNMLCEGADYPWLMWGCFRRNVGSRVRFLQELGRFLRSHPGKTHATIYDPNDLFGAHRISYEAALGEIEIDVLEEVIDLPPAELVERISKEKDAVALQIFEMELRRLVVACDAAGMCPDRPITKKKDRGNPSKPLQVLMCGRLLPPASMYLGPWLPFFQMIVDRCSSLTYGACSDLGCVLSSITEAKQFPPIDSEGKISAVPGSEWPARWEQAEMWANG